MLKKVLFKKTGEMIPQLGLGMMRLPMTEKEEIDVPRATALVDLAYESGIRYFDTALGYHNGKSASFMGEALCKYPRESMKYANKLPMWAVKEKSDLSDIFEKQLSDLKTDYIDFYLLHAMNSDNWTKAKEFGALDYLVSLKEKGIIKNLGFSFHGSTECLCEMLDSYGWDFVQLQLNYLDWYAGTARREYGLCTERGIPVTVMEPVRGGSLADAKLPPSALALLPKSSGNSGARFALRFVSSLENTFVVLSGMSNEEQLLDNIETFSASHEFSSEDEKTAIAAINAIKDGKVVFCTACGYCTEVCPAGVMIPKIFAGYNRNGELNEKYTENANRCIECGACTERCPQKLNIPVLIKNIL